MVSRSIQCVSMMSDALTYLSFWQSWEWFDNRLNLRQCPRFRLFQSIFRYISLLEFLEDFPFRMNNNKEDFWISLYEIYFIITFYEQNLKNIFSCRLTHDVLVLTRLKLVQE